MVFHTPIQKFTWKVLVFPFNQDNCLPHGFPNIHCAPIVKMYAMRGDMTGKVSENCSVAINKVTMETTSLNSKAVVFGSPSILA